MTIDESEVTRNSVVVHWSIEDEGGATVTNYKLSHYQVGSFPKTVTLDAPMQSYTFTDLTEGAEQTFTIVAINEAGASKSSEPISVMTRTAPGIP